MERVSVSSSNIRAIGYDSSTSTLEVEFTTGSIYQYHDVPQSEFDAMLNAESKGRYFSANIRNNYPYAKL